MMRSRITTRNRVTVPKPLRDLIGIGPGSEVDIFKRNGEVILLPRDPEARKRLRALNKILDHWAARPK